MLLLLLLLLLLVVVVVSKYINNNNIKLWTYFCTNNIRKNCKNSFLDSSEKQLMLYLIAESVYTNFQYSVNRNTFPVNGV